MAALFVESDEEISAEPDEFPVSQNLYSFEPLFSETEISDRKKIKKARARFNKVLNKELSDDRLQSLIWCSCENCSLANMKRPKEAYCCHELKQLPATDFAKFDDEDCLSKSSGFIQECLNKEHLFGILLALEFGKTKSNESAAKPVTNRSLRYGAYVRFSTWFHGKLGYRNRKEIPACIVAVIRKTFPDADGAYGCYQSGSETDSSSDES